MPLEMLMQEAKGMTDESLMEVIHFMQFLKIAPMRTLSATITPVNDEKTTVYREPGLYKGQIKMAEEFDAPLDDFEEYM